MKLSLRISWLLKIFHLRNWVNMLIRVEMRKEKMRLQKMTELSQQKPKPLPQKIMPEVILQPKLKTREARKHHE